MRYGVMVVASAAAMAWAGAAQGQPATAEILWQASFDRGTSWQMGWIVAAPGQAYTLQAVASWSGGTAAIGFAGATFEQIDFAGAGADDVFGGASGVGGTPTYTKRLQGVAETWTLQAGTGASVGGLKIDNVVLGNRTNFGQLPKILPGGIPNPSFDAGNPVVLFQMDAITGMNAKIMTISASWTRLGTPVTNEFRVYTTETGTSKKPAQEAGMNSIVIDTITPAPGTAMLLGIAGLAGSRRRRRV